MSLYKHPSTSKRPEQSVSYSSHVDILMQIEYLKTHLEGRRSSRENAWNEFTRYDGEVQMYEALLNSLLGRSQESP